MTGVSVLDGTCRETKHFATGYQNHVDYRRTEDKLGGRKVVRLIYLLLAPGDPIRQIGTEYSIMHIGTATLYMDVARTQSAWCKSNVTGFMSANPDETRGKVKSAVLVVAKIKNIITLNSTAFLLVPSPLSQSTYSIYLRSLVKRNFDVFGAGYRAWGFEIRRSDLGRILCATYGSIPSVLRLRYTCRCRPRHRSHGQRCLLIKTCRESSTGPMDATQVGKQVGEAILAVVIRRDTSTTFPWVGSGQVGI